jgi:putative acetyltransferase
MTLDPPARDLRVSYVVRKLRPADVPALVHIIETVRREYDVQHRIRTVLEASDRDLYGTYQNPRSSYFVALHGSVAVGGAGIAPLAGADEETCELQRMYLSLPHRKQGIGRWLLQECLLGARALGFRRCYAETISEMQAAIRFYEANGFRRLSAPVGSSRHEHNNCWLLRDLEAD